MLSKTPFTFLIHIALAIIVAGAFVTHFTGVQGSIHLIQGDAPTDAFTLTSGSGPAVLPFTVALDTAEIIYYPATTTPMDFRSVLRTSTGHLAAVSMNKVAVIDSWRFYQSGMGDGSSTLSVSHDPLGTGITYTGYILLGIGMLGFFFQKHTFWRSLLRRKAITAAILLLTVSATANAADSACGRSGAELHAMQPPLAADFGRIYVYWNDRICPLQTMALDVTAKLYGSRTYAGLSAEQVLSGWLFFYDEWLRDYEATHPYPENEKARKNEDERRALIRWVGSGQAFRIYPYRAATGRTEWLSLSERRPSKMPVEQWLFMLTAMPEINRCVALGRNIEADKAIANLIEGQRRYGGLSEQGRYDAELFYNRYVRLLPLALALLFFGFFGIRTGLQENPGKKTSIITFSAASGAVCLAVVLLLRGYIGNHCPLSNGCETMLFMAFAAVTSALCVRGPLIKGALLLVAAMACFVAVMTEKTPQIGALMPVLASPLLTVHVLLVMCSYVGFMLMAVLAAVALVRGGATEQRLARVNAIILAPAEFLLAAGIFVGAVWANQSWGRYWGWDPKETCALVTMLIYAVPLHRVFFRRLFRKPARLHIYLLLVVLSVLFTYFGANYLLPGLHSYA